MYCTRKTFACKCSNFDQITPTTEHITLNCGYNHSLLQLRCINSCDLAIFPSVEGRDRKFRIWYLGQIKRWNSYLLWDQTNKLRKANSTHPTLESAICLCSFSICATLTFSAAVSNETSLLRKRMEGIPPLPVYRALPVWARSPSSTAGFQEIL